MIADGEPATCCLLHQIDVERAWDLLEDQGR